VVWVILSSSDAEARSLLMANADMIHQWAESRVQ
jgi:hypothetical protein